MKHPLCRLITTLLLSCALLSFPALAKKSHYAAAQEELIEQGNYVNSDGETVHRPAHTRGDKVPEGATARCRDNTYSFSTHHRGTCSHHGGVAEWLD